MRRLLRDPADRWPCMPPLKSGIRTMNRVGPRMEGLRRCRREYRPRAARKIGHGRSFSADHRRVEALWVADRSGPVNLFDVCRRTPEGRDRPCVAAKSETSDYGQAHLCLAPQAVQILFETLRRLASEGCSILYISHTLAEIKALCTAATVLRAGKVIATCDPRRETASELARMMIGNSASLFVEYFSTCASLMRRHVPAVAEGGAGAGTAHMGISKIRTMWFGTSASLNHAPRGAFLYVC
jgi:hypothetical protein